MMSDLTGALVALAAFLLFGGSVLIGKRVLLSMSWTRPVRLLTHPVPLSWAGIVRKNVPISRELRAPDFERLLKLVQVFIKKKHVEGAGGLEMTEEIAVTIAAQACFLLLWLEVGLYPALRTVIVYPGTVVPRYARGTLGHGTLEFEGDEDPILGQSWGQGVVILSWDSAQRGAFDPRDGKNVVFHEFAHQLDQETGAADGLPVGLRLSSLKPWAEVIERKFRQLERAERSGRDTVLDTYGATNHAEFFAVATEAFFEKPRQLRERQPDLYTLLSEFYGVDPVEGWGPIMRGPNGA